MPHHFNERLLNNRLWFCLLPPGETSVPYTFPTMLCGCGMGKEMIQLLPAGRAGPCSRSLSGIEESWISQKKPFQCQHLISKPPSDMPPWMARVFSEGSPWGWRAVPGSSQWFSTASKAPPRFLTQERRLPALCCGNCCSHGVKQMTEGHGADE